MENSKRDEDKRVHDSSVDHKGKIPIRASTGVWKASLFIIDKLRLLPSGRGNFLLHLILLRYMKFQGQKCPKEAFLLIQIGLGN